MKLYFVYLVENHDTEMTEREYYYLPFRDLFSGYTTNYHVCIQYQMYLNQLFGDVYHIRCCDMDIEKPKPRGKENLLDDATILYLIANNAVEHIEDTESRFSIIQTHYSQSGGVCYYTENLWNHVTSCIYDELDILQPLSKVFIGLDKYLRIGRTDSYVKFKTLLLDNYLDLLDDPYNHNHDIMLDPNMMVKWYIDNDYIIRR